MFYKTKYLKAKAEAEKWRKKYFDYLEWQVNRGEILYNEAQLDWMIEHPRPVPTVAFGPRMRFE